MAKAKQELPKAESLYNRDFVGWTQQQAQLLRREATLKSGTDLDLENLAEEIESLGKRDRRALTNNVARVAEHLLKLQYLPAKDPRPGWENSVDVHRSKARKILGNSPGPQVGPAGYARRELRRRTPPRGRSAPWGNRSESAAGTLPLYRRSDARPGLVAVSV